MNQHMKQQQTEHSAERSVAHNQNGTAQADWLNQLAEQTGQQDSSDRSAHVRSITLVRHGRTSYNAAHRLQGQVDIPLDEVGCWQVEQTACELKKLYVDGHHDMKQVVVCSDLGRAAATAHAFADLLGVSVYPDERVRERDFGQWEGVAVQELAQRYPEDFQSWMHNRGGELKYGAEPKSHVGARGVEALQDWSSRYSADTDLYVFSHGAWISQTLQTLLGIAQAYPDYANMTAMRNAHWARLVPLDLPNGEVRWRLAEYNHGPVIAYTQDWENPPMA